jgi:adenine-specific DNA methylase
MQMNTQEYREWKANNPDEFKGWTPTCSCDTDATEPGIALDPFAGAGTTLLKAKELGRRFVGIELNPEYADMARARIGLSPNDPANVRSDDAQQGFEAYTDGGR